MYCQGWSKELQAAAKYVLMWMLHCETNYVRQIPRKHLLQCPKFHSFLGFRRLCTSLHHGVHSCWKVFLCMGFCKVMYGAWAVAIVLCGSFGVYWCWQRSRTFHITVTQGWAPLLCTEKQKIFEIGSYSLKINSTADPTTSFTPVMTLRLP
jgi:hypothetical protein